jgi:hypothetical protein
MAVERRQAYLADHPVEVAAYPVIRRAELARELELRAEAAVHPPDPVVAALGQSPANPIARRAWIDAAELAAVHHERYGIKRALDGGDVAERAVGRRPAAVGAALSWDRAADAVRAADAAARSVHEPRPDRPIQAQLEELSLLD